jgi:multidrug resistance efflux pump
MRRDLEDVRGLIDGLTIRTPIPGVFEIMYNRSTGALTKVGDKGGSRNKIAIVPDLRWMKVNTYVNEVDILKGKEGQKVAVRWDAMNNRVFDGEIADIGKLCKQRSGSNIKEKVFDVEVKLLQSDERLKPGMTVSCQFL